MKFNPEKLEEMKRNSKGAYSYLQKVTKEYLNGKTMLDDQEFIDEFKVKHSEKEVNYLYNQLTSLKEGNVFFTNGFISIFIPLYTLLFSVINIFVSSLLRWNSSTTSKLIDIELKKKEPNLTGILNNHNNILLDMFDSLLIGSSLLLIFFAGFFVTKVRKSNRKLFFISLLESVKYQYKTEGDQPSITENN